MCVIICNRLYLCNYNCKHCSSNSPLQNCIQSKPPKVVQKVHKKSINIQDLKSIVCTNETEPHKVKKTIGESPVIAENEVIP